ncbi:MAG: hypothetical protein ACIALR_06990 [Blastopirellula sp. JB062]
MKSWFSSDQISRTMGARTWRTLVVGTAAFLAAGCGGSVDQGPPYHASGQVEYMGKQVPAGTIYFIPDSSQGNSGPQGIASIKDGKYDTRESRFGVQGGAYIIRIEGFDGIQPVDDVDGLSASGKQLFKTFQTKRTFSKANVSEDFVVPRR